jgi:hypothetical protein
MKVVTILTASAFRIFRPFGSFGYLPDAIKKTVEQFQFVDYPKEASQLFPADTSQPINFRHGKVVIDDRVVVIDWLQIYVAGIQVATQTNTTNALAALDHIADWGVREFGLTLEPVKSPGFFSQLNIRFEKPLPELFPQFKPIARELSAKHPDFLSFRPEFELGALQFVYEAKANFNPVPFRLERATNVNFAENLYLSDAPLATDDHIKVLEDFEAVGLGRDSF